MIGSIIGFVRVLNASFKGFFPMELKGMTIVPVDVLINEKGIIKSCNNEKYQLDIGKEILSIDSKYFRPTEVDLLIGDPTKAKNKLGWELEHDLPSLVKDMMQSDLKLVLKDQFLRDKGFETPNYYE